MIYPITLLCALLAAANVSGAYVDPALRRSLRSQSTANVIVSMKGGVDPAIARTKFKTFGTRTQQLNALSDALYENAQSSQQAVIGLLEADTNRIASSTYESFWISNSLYITNATPELIQKISELPQVQEIHQENIVELEPLMEGEELSPLGNVEWGISKVAAEPVWATGNTGENIIVGSIDTGVRVSHATLKDNYVGAEANGWYDPYDKTSEPNDQNGHGTHTMGTIVGSNGIGVAPGAKWLSCKGCSQRGCSEAALLGCGQYILCPTNPQGGNKDCSLAPHISSNSWGGGQGKKWYSEVVKSWHAAGIVPVFANGNSGPSCRTANSPGDYENVIGVGASTSSDGLASFSSVGPTVAGLIKPDVSAPGHNVRSAWHTGDSSYKSISGTSMACPHTAGVIALMLSHQNSLNYDAIYTALTRSATRKGLNGPGKTCGGISEAVFPNNAFGHGVIHAENAIAAIDGKHPTPSPTQEPTVQPTDAPVACRWDGLAGACVPRDQCLWSWWQWRCIPW